MERKQEVAVAKWRNNEPSGLRLKEIY